MGYVNRIHINRIRAARARPPRNLYTATSLHGSASAGEAARAAIQARGHALVRGRRAAAAHAQAGLPRDGEVLRPVRPDGVPAVPPEGAAARAARFASSTRGVKRLPGPAPARDRDVSGRRQGRFARGVRSDLLYAVIATVAGVAYAYISGRRRTDGVEFDATPSMRCHVASPTSPHRHNTQAATPTRTARRTSSTRVSERSSTRTRLCSATSRSASRRGYVNKS